MSDPRQGSLLPDDADLPDADRNALGPFQRTSETSRRAALDNYPRSGSQRWRVLDAIARAEAKGLTRDELCALLGLQESSVHPRVVELRGSGWIEENGETRQTRQGCSASVLVLTEAGRKVLGRQALDLDRGTTKPRGREGS